MKFKKTLIITLASLAAVALLSLVVISAPALVRPNQADLAKRTSNDARQVCSAANQWWSENAKTRCTLADTFPFIDYSAPKFPDLHRWLQDYCHLPASCPWPRTESTAQMIRVADWRDGHAVSDYMSAVDPRATGVVLAEHGFFALRVDGLDRHAATAPAEFRAQLQPESDVVVFEADTAWPAAPAATKPPGRP